MEKQIEGIARIICKPTANKGNCERCGFRKQCSKFDDAKALYNAGYRKQEEGEWLCIYLNKFEHLSKHKCSECGFVNTTRYNYCPSCGAKMKED